MKPRGQSSRSQTDSESDAAADVVQLGQHDGTTLTALESKYCVSFVRFWALAQLIDFVFGNATAGGKWELLQLTAVVRAGLFPDDAIAVRGAFVFRAACVAVRAPWAWDGEFLTAFTEIVFIVHMGIGGPDALRALGETIRSQMAVFYFFAGFWKVNSAFLDPKYSCASVYFIQLVDAYVPASLVTDELVSFAASVAPAATILLECSIGLAMAVACWIPFRPLPAAMRHWPDTYNPRASTWSKLGVFLGCMLHFGIALTPKPNNIALFGVMVAVRYFWFVPAGATAAIEEALESPLRVGAVHVLAAAILLGITLVCQEGWGALVEVQDGTRPFSSLDRPMLMWSILTTLLLRALVLDTGPLQAGSRVFGNLKECSLLCPSARPRTEHRVVTVLGFAVVLVWTLGPLLGLQDIGCEFLPGHAALRCDLTLTQTFPNFLVRMMPTVHQTCSPTYDSKEDPTTTFCRPLCCRPCTRTTSRLHTRVVSFVSKRPTQRRSRATSRPS